MCGICGVVALSGSLELPVRTAERMIGVIRHRGPDEFGAWRDESVFLGHARLSIIDPDAGQQPLADADGHCRVTYHGEIFNYIELARELAGRGHVFRTRSDTEVIVRAYLEWGPDCVERFNGQFAFALWDTRRQSLFLARDRFGICPLYVAMHENRLLFASEIKSLKAYPGARFDLDPVGMAEVLAYWANLGSGTCFDGVAQLPPGHYALVEGPAGDAGNTRGLPSCLAVTRYWSPGFLPAGEDRRSRTAKECRALAAGLRDELNTATSLRLRADVPVSAYVSGGLDSSALAVLAQRASGERLDIYGLGFAAADYDERPWQKMMGDQLGVRLHAVDITDEQLVERFRAAVWNTETPLSRTSAAPLLALSERVHDRGGKVVLTGEGADEVLVGYNIFREAKIRRFWQRDPTSARRPLLLTRLAPHADKPPLAFLRQFYGQGLADTSDPFFSHRPRWRNTATTGFMSRDARERLTVSDPEGRLAASLPRAFTDWGPVARAQYLEMILFLSGYLLSAQGDRMLMANSVEGRFPYLDHNLVAYAAAVPAAVKLQSLREKALFRDSVRDLVPPEIANRPKYPYRAPGGTSFKSAAGAALVQEFLVDGNTGWELWQRDKVSALVAKWRAGRLSGARDDQSFLAVLSGRMMQADFGCGFESRVAAVALAPDQINWRK